MSRLGLIAGVLIAVVAATWLPAAEGRQERYSIRVRVALSEGQSGPLLAGTPLSIRVRDRLRRNHQHYRLCFAPAPEQGPACRKLRLGRFAAVVTFAAGCVKIRAKIIETGKVLVRHIQILPRD